MLVEEEKNSDEKRNEIGQEGESQKEKLEDCFRGGGLILGLDKIKEDDNDIFPFLIELKSNFEKSSGKKEKRWIISITGDERWPYLLNAYSEGGASEYFYLIRNEHEEWSALPYAFVSQ